MPYVKNGEIQVYYETIGKGPPLLLHHGLEGSLIFWKRYKYVDKLKEKYYLILMDARGHGKSSKPHNPEQYSMKQMTSDAIAVIDELKISKIHFWGYSMGGRIGIALGKYYPDRLHSLIIGGFGPIEKSKERMEQQKVYYTQDVNLVLASIEKEIGSKLEDDVKREWLNNDFEALIAYCSYYENIGMADYLPSLTVPCLMYAGDVDQLPHSKAKEWVERMKNAEFVSLPGLNHRRGGREADAVLPLILKFLAKIS